MAYWKKKAAVRICHRCGRQFNQKRIDCSTFCSRECYYADHSEKAKKRELAKLSVAKLPRRNKCRSCQWTFIAEQNQKFCSKPCRMAHLALMQRMKYFIPTPPRRRICISCGSVYCVRGKIKGMAASGGRNKCDDCTELQNDLARREHKSRRRARIKNARVEAVSALGVFSRDSWICQICLMPTDRDAKVPEPLAPVLDHIVPLAHGGEHSMANIQCAHFYCNCIKSDKMAYACEERVKEAVRHYVAMGNGE
jgi:5-methylcytosine-specific restriction endonuclease McrA